ncbi:hypothetical protein [Streptomyces spongiae]|uniref:Uncharacterized protein n=1 Tax=Streptomyces spongiae TaxID=565072 RepID=A0A5N8XJ73_9ACTN|nr:hypothetical protein [Streptomyces spongiae]MPY59146.1 hypothetical protein [Streptomyces spongiae]
MCASAIVPNLLAQQDPTAGQLQARMLADGDEPDNTEVEQFCERARELFRAITDSSVEDRS